MKVVYEEKFRRQFSKLDKGIQRQIYKYLSEIEALDDPRSRGKPLKYKYAGLWRYRVGDYRIFCKIADAQCIVYAVDVGHRRKIYKP